MKGISIFLTGSTGFLGRCTLYMLLDKYGGDIDTIHLLIREKKHVLASDRFNEILKNEIFRKIFEDNPGFADKIKIVSGDLSFSTDWKNHDIGVTHVINCAAAVDFDLPVFEAFNDNVLSVMNVLDFCRAQKQLKRIVHVSTCYVNKHSENANDIKMERLIDIDGLFPDKSHMTFDSLIKLIPQKKISMKDVGNVFPNSYTFTKCLAENYISRNKHLFTDVPITIIRPSIITAAVAYPYPSWSETKAALSAFFLGFYHGFISDINVVETTPLNLIPVDIVSDNIIKETMCPIEKQTMGKIKMIHAASPNYQEFTINSIVSVVKNPKRIYKGVQNLGHMRLANRFLHFVVYYFNTCVIKLLSMIYGMFDSRASRRYQWLLNAYQTLYKSMLYFTNNTWIFSTNNMHKGELYQELEQMNRYEYIHKMHHWTIARYTDVDLNLCTIKDIDMTWYQIMKNIFFEPLMVFLYIPLMMIIRSIYKNILIYVKNINTDEMHTPGSKKSYIVISNHQSHFDNIFIIYILYCTNYIAFPWIIAKSMFKRIPIISMILRKLKLIYVGEGTDNSDTKTQIKNILDKRENIMFYPEGSRSRTGLVGDCKAGIFKYIYEYCADAETQEEIDKRIDNIVIVPVNIRYDNVVGVESYDAELLGRSYNHTSIFNLIKWILRIPFTRYGNVVIDMRKKVGLRSILKINADSTRIDTDAIYKLIQHREIDEGIYKTAEPVIKVKEPYGLTQISTDFIDFFRKINPMIGMIMNSITKYRDNDLVVKYFLKRYPTEHTVTIDTDRLTHVTRYRNMLLSDLLMYRHIVDNTEDNLLKTNFDGFYFGNFCKELDALSVNSIYNELRSKIKTDLCSNNDRYTLVTGGTGFVGNHVIRRIMNDDPDEKILILTSNTDTRRKIREYCDTHNIDTHKVGVIIGSIDRLMDIDDDRLFRLNKIIHMAGHVAHTRKSSEVQKMIDVNVTGTYHIMRLALTNHILCLVDGSHLKFWYLSTSGTKHIYKDPERKIRYDPMTHYGVVAYVRDTIQKMCFNASKVFPYYESKIISEQIIENLNKLCKTTMKINIICPSMILGSVVDVFETGVSYSRSIVNKFMNKKFPVVGVTGSVNFVDVDYVTECMVKDDMAIDHVDGNISHRVLTGYDMSPYDLFKKIDQELNIGNSKKSLLPYKVSDRFMNILYYTFISRLFVDDVYIEMSRLYWGPKMNDNNKNNKDKKSKDICIDKLDTVENIIRKSYV